MRKLLFWLSIVILIFSSFSLGFAQQRTRSTNRVTPKPSPTPSVKTVTEDLSIISLADDQPVGNTNTKQTKKTSKTNTQPEAEQDFLRRTITDLTTEISTLSERVAQMEEKQQQLIDLEMLTRAETRAETLHQQLFEVLSKEAELKGRMSQIEYESRPEIIERSMSGIGTTRPEELRDARRIQLQAEKQRVQEQLTMIQQNRIRLEVATANADQLVERLSSRLEESFNSPLPRPVRKSKEKQTDNKPDEDDPQKPN